MKDRYNDMSKIANRAHDRLDELEKLVEELSERIDVQNVKIRNIARNDEVLDSRMTKLEDKSSYPDSAEKECEHYWIREISTDCEYCNRCWTRRKYQPQKEPCYCEPKYIYADCPKHGLPKVEGLADRLRKFAILGTVDQDVFYKHEASVARQYFRELVESCCKEYGNNLVIDKEMILKRLEQ